MSRTLQRAALAIAVLAAVQPACAADNAALRRELQSIYDRASTAQRSARTLADLDAIHAWLDTADCTYADSGQPRRTWDQMRNYAERGLATRLKAFTTTIATLSIEGNTATTTAIVRGVASVPDGEGRFGARGAVHEMETTATVRDVWVKSSGTWRRMAHDKIVPNRVTAVDGGPIR